MFSRLFKVFELQEKDLSKSRLNFFRGIMVLAMPFIPLLTFREFGSNSDVVLSPILVLIIITGLFFLITACSRYANRYWTPNKYLDESEVQLKTASMSFAYQIIGWVGAIALLFAALTNWGWDSSQMEFSRKHILYVMFNGLGLMLFLPLIYIMWALRPIDNSDAGDGDFTWRKKPGAIAAGLAFVFIVGFASVVIADALYDANYDLSAACPDGVFKTYDSKGLFKVEVTCQAKPN